ncbi:MAG: Lrp/AsnC family transcriptional regulator [Candidatus Bathyarchaeota archaeon]|nr:Lrp/AsnC family transcriptional regulator [Candidatus Bathyarchaeota archaeon]
MEALTRRPMQLLRMLHEKGKSTNTYTLRVKQNDLAKQLGISRQALNVHLRKLRDLKYIRTGRGFIDVTETGLNVLGVSSTPAFVFIKVSPRKRSKVYEEIKRLTVQRAFRVAGDIDALLMVERNKLDEVLRKLSSIDGVKDTKSYVAIEPIR